MRLWDKKQLTKTEAVEFYHSKSWEKMSEFELFEMQLYQKRLCIPFEIFHKTAEKILNRPVWTHEFAFHKKMIEEFLGIKNKPSFTEILNLIPKDKTIVILNKNRR